jgi:hypothetical protein
VSETDFSARESGGHDPSAPSARQSGHARRHDSATWMGFSDPKYPHRFAYAPCSCRRVSSQAPRNLTNLVAAAYTSCLNCVHSFPFMGTSGSVSVKHCTKQIIGS